jgi:adenylate cyclase
MPAWQLRVSEKQTPVYSDVFEGAAELGRQNVGERGPFWKKRENGLYRVVIAPLEDQRISRRQLLVEPVAGDRVKLTNTSSSQSVRLADGTKLDPGDACEVPLPAVFTLGEKTVRVFAAEEEEDAADLRSLAQATIPPGREFAGRASFASLGLTAEMASERVLSWLRTTMGVLQSASGSQDFLAKAARAVVDLVNLDSGRVLLRSGEEWAVQAVQTEMGGVDIQEWCPSRKVLHKVLTEKKTFWQAPALAHADSLKGVHAVVAAPILNPKGEVIGALYGERRKYNAAAAAPISNPEAMLVEVLATSVAAGLARVEQEKAAVRARVQFEQFFTPRLARLLDEHPELLEGKDAEVTVLFCDVRGFSAASEVLGPRKTFEWISDVMNALSKCVLEEEGVLVDYIGDELIAMWGAPDQQPDHGRRACRAALDMAQSLERLNAKWQPVLGAAMDIGIGINSGPARVGNTGSTVKFKYGPLGNTVNLASRVQGASKYLKTRLLITKATRALLDDAFCVRRLCDVRVVNISEAVGLYELVHTGMEGWQELRDEYEAALTQFEKKEFRQAARILGKLLPEHPYDGPALALMARAVQCLSQEPAKFDPVWELPGK